MDKSSIIFGNPIPNKTIKKANKSKKKYIKAFGDDTNVDYYLKPIPIDTLDFISTSNLVLSDHEETLPGKPLIVGNIRMGFGHYRISIAIASCAKALGYDPYWLDLASLDTTGSKMIRKQNDMYSLASRISQKSKLFNKIIWEPLNSEGFKKITYNAVDQKNSELLAPIFKHLDKDIPYVATHVWPSQGAIHGGMKHVVNAIPDNWAMGLHLSEGAIHVVQTPFAYLGYKTLNGFAKKPLKGLPASDLKMVGCYIDHELLVNLKEDNELRIKRLQNDHMRILLTVGGAGAGGDMFTAMIKHLLPLVKEGRVSLFINFGDHLTVYEKMKKEIKDFNPICFFDEYDKFKELVNDLRTNDNKGIYAIYNKDIFKAVYSTNLIMKECDLLITKPGELAYYPIPKLFMKHIGGHEVYGAIHSQEFGDSTFECPTKESICNMLDRLIDDKEIMYELIKNINKLNDEHYYDGAYKAVKLAAGTYEE